MIEPRRIVVCRLVTRIQSACALVLARPHAVAVAALATLGCLVALGQYQANRRTGQPIYGSGGGGGGSVRYGYVAPKAPRSSELLPSEYRNAQYRSGALPSEIRSGYRSAGPIAPGGRSAYIQPGGPVVVRTDSGPQPYRANVMAPNTGGSLGLPASPSIKYPSANQIKWGGPVSSTAMPNRSIPSAAPLPTMTSNPFGTIKYPGVR